MSFARVLIFNLLVLSITRGALCAAETLTVDQPVLVEDVALLDGEFARWNFGASPFLEVGRTMGIYAEHSAVTLIRFNLEGVQADEITGAKLLLYKPRSFTQLQPISVRASEITHRNRAWKEGRGFAEAVVTGASYNGLDSKRPWAGADGAGLIGMDYIPTVLDTSTARDDKGHWIAFELPPALVENWIKRPDANSGLRLSLAPSRDPQWGDHVHFHSSEHYSGNRPRLELTGSGLRQVVAPTANDKAAFRLPAKDAAFRRWCKSGSRMARFTRNLELEEDVALIFYFYDTQIRDVLVNARYRGPITLLLPRLDQAIKSRDEVATRACLDELREMLLVWEAIREVTWYTAGPLAEHLTPTQLAKLYTQNMWNRLEDKANAKKRSLATERGEDPNSARGVWEPLTGDELRKHQQRAVNRIISNTHPDPREIEEITPSIREFVRLEQSHLETFVRYLEETRLHAEGRGGSSDVWDTFRLMNHHHEAFLYYQSLFNTPRWHFLAEKTPLFEWARWIREVGSRYALSERQAKSLDLK